MNTLPTCGGHCGCGSTTAATSAPIVPLPSAADAPQRESVFDIPGMDCPSEEQMIRLRLADGAAVFGLDFDLGARRLTVRHSGSAEAVLERLLPLGFGARLSDSRVLGEGEAGASSAVDDAAERRVLRWLLAINASMFFVELGAGWWAQSAGLLADSLDMFADASVYGLSLYAVGRSAALKLRAAHLAGWLELALALGALAEVGRRMLFGAEPAGAAMIGIALLALVANVACLLLLMRHRDGGVHMQASLIFSANDVIANAGVILAGALVAWSASPWPDWIIGMLIAAIVLRGAVRILRLR